MNAPVEPPAPTEIIIQESLPVDDSGILEVVVRALEKLFINIETVFNEMVMFVKSVTFQSTVLFEDRVIFSDKDMAGSAMIPAGSSSVRVDFTRPYLAIPRIVVTADAFITYRVTEK